MIIPSALLSHHFGNSLPEVFPPSESFSVLWNMMASLGHSDACVKALWSHLALLSSPLSGLVPLRVVPLCTQRF